MRRFARVLAWLMLMAGAVPVGVYALGRALTDRLSWSQFLFWIPASLLVGAAAVLISLAWGLSRVRRRDRHGALGRSRLLGRCVAWCALAAGLAGVHATWQARVHRWVLPGPEVGVGPTLRVVHWTAMAPDVAPRDTTLPGLIEQFEPDLMLLTMALAPHQYDGLVSRLPEEFDSAHAGLFTVASRLPILSRRVFNLGLAENDRPALPPGAAIDPRQPAPVPDESRHWIEYFYNQVRGPLGLPRRYFRNADPGWLLVLTLDGTQRFGRPVTVYFYDLPSDPLRSKAELAERVTRVVGELERAGDLPPPDLIVGDFNIPRGSASLGRMTRGYASAHDDAGIGPCSTWPRARPILHLDHLLRSPAWRARKYQVFDPGSGDHLAQWSVLEWVERRGAAAAP
ncbi:MAG: endonuclease/exonuclease/phosphatase family protein [Phycisphaerales bacterium]